MAKSFKGRLVELSVDTKNKNKFSAKFEIVDECEINNNEMYIIFNGEYGSKSCNLVYDNKISFKNIGANIYSLLSSGFNEKLIVEYENNKKEGTTSNNPEKTSKRNQNNSEPSKDDEEILTLTKVTRVR